jgi:hypothetical protein
LQVKQLYTVHKSALSFPLFRNFMLDNWGWEFYSLARPSRSADDPCCPTNSLHFLMASKSLKLSVAGTEVAAELQSKVTKDDLYGRVARVVEQDGKSLERGYLLPDGTILRKSQVAMSSVDAEGSPAEAVEIRAAGHAVEIRPSSFDGVESLEPVSLETVARFVTSDVYPLTLTGLEPGVYRGNFNYRKSARPKDALVMVRADGAFLLVGQLRACPMVERTVTYEFFDSGNDAADDAGDPLDFSMM